MTRWPIWLGAAALAGLASWQTVKAVNEAEPVEKPAVAPAAKPAPAPSPPAAVKDVTAMNERVAVLGILNKRNGLYRDLTIKPGQRVRIGDLVVRLQACEQTAPWEQEKWTGAFVQVIVNDPDRKWRKYFSGWLYKESPSLNVVEHPIWDVWVKDCQMKYPDTGKDTVLVRGGDDGASVEEGDRPTKRSSARRSAPAVEQIDEPSAEPAEEQAVESNDQ